MCLNPGTSQFSKVSKWVSNCELTFAIASVMADFEANGDKAGTGIAIALPPGNHGRSNLDGWIAGRLAQSNMLPVLEAADVSGVSVSSSAEIRPAPGSTM